MMLKSPDLRYRVWRDFFLYLADSCYNIGLLSTGGIRSQEGAVKKKVLNKLCPPAVLTDTWSRAAALQPDLL